MGSSSDKQRQKAIAEYCSHCEELLREAGWNEKDRETALGVFSRLAEDELLFEELAEVTPLVVEELRNSPDPVMALHNWDRYLQASYSRDAFLGLLLASEGFRSTFFRIVGTSQFLSDIIIRNPEYLEWALSEAPSEHEKSLEDFREQLANAVAPFRRIDARRRALCRFKRRELLRIGVRDIFDHASLETLCQELSSLAQAACELAVADTVPPLEERFGRPEIRKGLAEADGCGLAVIAMGKFGGGELNFSSDIDLNFVYANEGHTAGTPNEEGKRKGILTNHEYFCKMAADIVGYLSVATTEGVLYRVDTRLRPDGASGAIARSASAYSEYLSNQARAWERIPYLKATLVAGDPTVGRRFVEISRAFTFGPVDPEMLLSEVGRLKRLIDYDANESDTHQIDIKRGGGGIREIEFITAVLQILHGANDPEVRVKPTLEGLKLLCRKGHLPTEDCRCLEDAYRDFRRIEHRLQMMQEQQTHALPSEEKERRVFAMRCGFTSLREFDELLRRHRSCVRGLFERVFHDTVQEKGPSLADYLASRRPPTPEVRQQLAPYGLGSVGGFQALRTLAVGSNEFAISQSGQVWFERLLPMLLEELISAAMPETAVHQLTLMLKSYRGISTIYELIQANPPILRLLVRVMGYGSYPARALIAHPEYFDEMLTGSVLRFGRSMRDVFEERLGPKLDDLEEDEALVEIRRFKEREGLFVAVSEILGIYTTGESAAATTELAQVCLRALSDLFTRGLSKDVRDGWCILGLGGFGSKQVHLTADLDVAFFFLEEDRRVDGEPPGQFYGKLASRIMSAMSAVSPDGQLWKMDARLRPDGVNAPLAVSLNRARRYYLEEAGIWEYQSVTRARVVAGSREAGQQVMHMFRECFEARQPIENLAEQIRSMRHRIDSSVRLPRTARLDLKTSPGGLVDVEFLIQYLQLRHGLEHAELLKPAPGEALEEIRKQGLLNEEDAAFVLEHDHLVRTLQRAIRLLWETSRSTLPAQEERLAILTRAVREQIPDVDDVLPTVERRFQEMRSLFERVLEQNGDG